MDINVNVNFLYPKQVEEIKALLNQIHAQLTSVQITEAKAMAIAQDILDAVTAETTVLDSFIALVNGLVANNTVTPAAATAIISAIKSNQDKLNAAIVANTPVGP